MLGNIVVGKLTRENCFKDFSALPFRDDGGFGECVDIEGHDAGSL